MQSILLDLRSPGGHLANFKNIALGPGQFRRHGLTPGGMVDDRHEPTAALRDPPGFHSRVGQRIAEMPAFRTPRSVGNLSGLGIGRRETVFLLRNQVSRAALGAGAANNRVQQLDRHGVTIIVGECLIFSKDNTNFAWQARQDLTRVQRQTGVFRDIDGSRGETRKILGADKLPATAEVGDLDVMHEKEPHLMHVAPVEHCRGGRLQRAAGLGQRPGPGGKLDQVEAVVPDLLEFRHRLVWARRTEEYHAVRDRGRRGENGPA